MTITNDALDLTVQGPSPPDMGPSGLLLLVTSGVHHWKPVQTCSLDFNVQGPTGADTWCTPKYIRLASGRYTPYWNSFLFLSALPFDYQ